MSEKIPLYIVPCVMGWSLLWCNAAGISEQQRLQSAWQLAKPVQQLHDWHMLNLNGRPNSLLFNDFGDVVLSGPGTLQQMPPVGQSVHGTDNLR